ncbi:MAG TPA: FMN-binding protein [Acidimicrobiia bacterium]|nr:FMN-binding protein [Acidimicrobiia bacterium]
MRRATPALIITAVGLGAIASFRSSPGLPTTHSLKVATPRTSTTPAASTPATTTPATTPATAPSGSPSSTPTTTPATTTITGDPYDNQYGTVQVSVTLQGGKITDVQALQLPDSHQRSVEISQAVAPILRQEALQAQSAQIDLVSGATYTSQSYAQSLQSALDKSHG